jgi:hypothetical protein
LATPTLNNAMESYDVKPHMGVGPIELLMPRAEVHRIFGDPKWVRHEREAFLEGFFVDFDPAGHVELIELGKSRHFRALFHGVCLHEVPAEEAVSFVSRYGEYDINHPELGYSYVFPDLQLSLWRGTKDRSFEAIGVAVDGYFKPHNKVRVETSKGDAVD